MRLDGRQERVIAAAEQALGTRIGQVQRPRQGMGSSVLLGVDERGRQLAIKSGAEVGGDVRALELLEKNRIDVPVPKILATGACDGQTVLVMERINSPLLEDVPASDKQKYLIPMLSNLTKIHAVRSDVAGPLDRAADGKTWKELLLFKYSGAHPWFDWGDIFGRAGVDGELLRRALAHVVGKISGTGMLDQGYSLLYTDFNQRNLFVAPATSEIAAIIDWSEAMFGDPLYDFARVRMFLFHFNLGEEACAAYYDFLGLTQEQKERERIYFLSQIIDYIAWYSQRRNSFNDGRLKLHQDFLRGCGW